MDCEQIKELLDLHALGIAEPEEAAAIEEHVADCVRCWSGLSEAQRAAAALALSTTLERAPQSLRRRILAEAQSAAQRDGPGLLERVRKLWPLGAGALAATAVASLAFALVLQTEVSDLRDDKDDLAAGVATAEVRLTEQQQLTTVLNAPDVQTVSLAPTSSTSSAGAVYHWSGSARGGALLCNNLPTLQEGQVYRVWFLTEGDSHSAGSFYTWDGVGQLSLDLDDLPESPVAIGVSIQDADGVEEPGEWFLFTELQQ